MSSTSKSGNSHPFEGASCSSSRSNRCPNPALANPVNTSCDHNQSDAENSKSKNLKRADEVEDDNCKSKKCKERSVRCLRMLTDKKKYGRSHDVTFEVGSEMVPITAHRTILAMNCPFFEYLVTTNADNLGEESLTFSQLDPVAFQKVLNYIYSNKITLSGSIPEEVLDILRAARRFGLEGLVTLCYEHFDLRVDRDNVFEMLRLAQERSDQRLEELTLNHISRHININEVFSSPRFLQLSEESLRTLLMRDDWNLEEVEVFHHVKSWASSKLVCQSGGVSRGQQIRVAMGQVFFAIRFPLMTEDEFYDRVLVEENEGLFSGEEFQELSKYFFNLRKNLNPNCLQRFVSRPRLHQPFPLSSAARVDNAEDTSPETNTDNSVSNMELNDESTSNGDLDSNISMSSGDHEGSDCTIRLDNEIDTEEISSIIYISDSSMEEDDDDEQLQGGDSVTSAFRSAPIIPETEPLDQPPPAKKSRIENPRETTHRETFTTIQKYVNRLEKSDEKDSIDVINETLFLSVIPHNRVHLPNLSEFNLRLILNSFKKGKEFKSYAWKKTEKLDRLLFFNTAPHNDLFSSSRERNLAILLHHNVNISIHFDDCLILKVNHDEGELTMNMVECAQEVIDALRNFPLKKLAINYCGLKSLKGLRQDLLETFVLNELTKLEDYVEFVRGCSSLREIAFDSSVSEMQENGISLNALVNKNEYLEKVSFAKGTLGIPVFPRPQGNRALREMSLQLRSYTPELISASSFPNLARVQLRKGGVDYLLFYNILKIESLEWIFVERELIDWRKGNVITTESRKLHKFLSKVFSSDPKLEPDWKTFILEKKDESEREVQPGTSKSMIAAPKYDPFDASKWKGQKLTDENKEEIMWKHHFKHFSYNRFYQDYETFSRFEFDD